MSTLQRNLEILFGLYNNIEFKYFGILKVIDMDILDFSFNVRKDTKAVLQQNKTILSVLENLVFLNVIFGIYIYIFVLRQKLYELIGILLFCNFL